MADGIFNIAKGKFIGYHDRVANSDPTNAVLVVVLLQDSATEADGTLQDYNTLALLLTGANDEATFTNYARIILDQTDITVSSPDDTNNWQQVAIANQTWSAAGGTLDNTMTKMILCYDDDSTGGNDTNLIPLGHFDFTPTTNGNDLVLQIDPDGYGRAA